MTREEKINLLNELLEYEEKNDIGNLTRAERGEFQQWVKGLEQEPILDKIRTDITKFADTIPFNIGEVKAKYRNFGQHDGLEQALEIIEGNIEGDFDIDKWMAESEG